MAAENKYGQVTTSQGEIPEDEPVFLFRARDALLPKVLNYYEHICREHGAPGSHIAAINDRAKEITSWQLDHQDRVHTPGSGD